MLNLSAIKTTRNERLTRVFNVCADIGGVAAYTEENTFRFEGRHLLCRK